ncbi:death-associated protein 1 [Phlebotomus argentipes]|uniref:death-associated protein 1 n=1 Tax=Phlebotomus argentipes TaxID=94469 RepID=UPI002892DCFE|nr:death-associated protein 1 [Phlebotomus argentipes]
MSDEENQKLAGHKPAVKVGGMRVVQHKNPNSEKTSGDSPEDTTGLAPAPTIPNSQIVSGAHTRGHSEFTPEAAQVAHSPKPPNPVSIKPQVNIQQPRK